MYIRKEGKVVVQPKVIYPNLGHIYYQIGRISELSSDINKLCDIAQIYYILELSCAENHNNKGV